MTADHTIEATPGQVAAYERDGFLVVVGQGTVPIVVEVVVPHPDCAAGRCSGPSVVCEHIARTLLRGTAEAVPVVKGKSLGLIVGQHPLGWTVWTRRVLDGAQLERDVTHHFADVPRPEVGDTARIIRGEG